MGSNVLLRKALSEIPMGTAQETNVKPVDDNFSTVAFKCLSKAAAETAFKAFKRRYTYGSGEIFEAWAINNIFGKRSRVNLLAD
jgi:hypothetical protein